jgi:hypothetical protein
MSASCQERTAKPLQLMQDSYRLSMNEFEYKYFLTITFKPPISIEEAVKSTNYIFHLANSRLFCRNYESDCFLEGWVSYEVQNNGSPHFHILIIDNERIDKSGGIGLLGILNESKSKVKNPGGYNVFGCNAFNVKVVHDKEKLIRYVLKDFKRHDGDNISLLNQDGIVFQLN